MSVKQDSLKDTTFTYGRYKIDEVLVLNLKSRPDRKWAAIGALTLAQCPLERVRIWNAAPASEFENTHQIGEAAAADGFPWLLDYANNTDLRLYVVAQAWSYCQMLRHLAEHNLTGIILYDDRYILDFEQLSAVHYWLSNFNHNDVRIPYLMLQCDYYQSLQHNIGYEWDLHPEFPYLAEGPLGGSENAVVYTSEGAKFFLDYLEKHMTENVGSTLANISYLPRSERFGVWTAYNCQLIKKARYEERNFGGKGG